MTDVSVVIRLASGDIRLSGDEIKSLEISESAGFGCVSVGASPSRRFTLTAALNGVSPEALSGARSEVVINGQAAGVFHISGINCPPGGAFSVITGADALSSLMDSEFSDSPAAYPRTVISLVRALVSNVPGMTVKDGFESSALRLAQMPIWPKGTSVRKIIGFIAFLAGANARVDDEGNLEFAPVNGDIRSCEGDLTLSGGAFAFNCLRYRFDGDDDCTRFAVNNEPDTARNAISACGNPLMNAARANGVKQLLTGFSCMGGSVKMYGALPPRAGDRARVNGRTLFVTSASLKVDSGGLMSLFTSDLPSKTGAGARFLPGAKAFNPDGTIRAEAVGGLDERLTGISRAYISSLTSDEISALGLTAKLIEAMTVKAREIDAASVKADELTALFAEIVNASVKKLTAGTVQTDELSAAIADIAAAKIGSLTSQSVSTDALAAALARFSVIAAGTAEFDRQTVKHLIAGALQIEDAAGENVYIKNLAIDSAQAVTAYINELCVKAKDGGFYRLSVSENGVTASPVSVTDAEIQNGVTASGSHIVETDLTVSDLCADSVKATRALIGKLRAREIDAGVLTADAAFINALNAMDITSNTYLRLALKDVRDGLDGAEGYIDGLKRWVTFGDEGMTQGKRGSVFSTLINQSGFHIKRSGTAGSVGSFDRNGLSAPGVTIGNITCRRTGRGGWAWTDAD